MDYARFKALVMEFAAVREMARNEAQSSVGRDEVVIADCYRRQDVAYEELRTFVADAIAEERGRLLALSGGRVAPKRGKERKT